MGFTLVDGRPTSIDPIAALFNPAWSAMAIHATIACYAAVGFAVAGIYAWALLHDRDAERTAYNRRGLVIAISWAASRRYSSR